MSKERIRRLMRIEERMRLAPYRPVPLSAENWPSLTPAEAAQRYFEFINVPISPAMAAASRASIAGISPAEATAAYERMMHAAA